MPTRGSISSYNIAGLISEVSEEVALKSPKIAVVNHPTLIWGPRQEKPLRISAYTLYFHKLESLAYIFVIICRYSKAFLAGMSSNLSGVVEIGEFAVFPLAYLRKLQK